MCFHNELCQVYNALMTALSLLREGSKVTMFFGSREANYYQNWAPNDRCRAKLFQAIVVFQCFYSKHC